MTIKYTYDLYSEQEHLCYTKKIKLFSTHELLYNIAEIAITLIVCLFETMHSVAAG